MITIIMIIVVTMMMLMLLTTMTAKTVMKWKMMIQKQERNKNEILIT